ncbi:MAG: hypothetical protein ACW99U_21910 [Candidatus Thorarchaeota archaeon]|jgi:hypothetical protein
MNTVELEDLVGMHVLSGVDRVTITPGVLEYEYRYEDSAVLNFVLDGKVYSAVEDGNDGYRSMLGEVQVSEGRLQNEFEPVGVLAVMRDDNYTEILDFYDVENGKLVLSVGTENTDDYYPWFVAEFEPRNLHVNERDPK